MIAGMPVAFVVAGSGGVVLLIGVAVAVWLLGAASRMRLAAVAVDAAWSDMEIDAERLAEMRKLIVHGERRAAVVVAELARAQTAVAESRHRYNAAVLVCCAASEPFPRGLVARGLGLYPSPSVYVPGRAE